MKQLTTMSTTLMLVALIAGLTIPLTTNKVATAPALVPAIQPAEKTVAEKAAKKSKSKEIHSWIKYKTVSRSSSRKGRTVTVEYPKFSGQPARGLGKLNRLMKKLVNTNMPHLEINTDPELSDFEFTCNYQVTHASPDLVSVSDTIWSYTGGAHGNGFTVPFNYSMTAKGPAEITLKNLFGKNTNLKALQDMLRPRLQAYLYPDDDCADTSWIENGTATLQDLSCFSLDKHGVTFHFQSYQVACYAAGAPDVELTYGELKNLFDSSSPVYKYVQAYEQLADANESCEAEDHASGDASQHGDS